MIDIDVQIEGIGVGLAVEERRYDAPFDERTLAASDAHDLLADRQRIRDD